MTQMPGAIRPHPPVPEGEKWCGKCARSKPQSAFSRNAAQRDGFNYWCKTCYREYAVARRAAKPDYFAAISRRKRLRERARIFAAYGDRCACCGETEPKFLALDHKDGGGGAHRREVGRGNVYFWVRRNGYPPGFQVLCHNCNMAKGFYGACPHQEAR